MSNKYQPVVFDISDEDPASDLAFQDFSGQIPSDRASSPSGAPPPTSSTSLFDPDRELANSINSSSPGSLTGFFNLNSWTGYFDVSTQMVLQRSWATMKPPFDGDYLVNALEERPDLYGPFWVPTTVIFTLFVTTTLTTSVQAYLADVKGYTYDFTSLGTAAAIVYGYSLIFPLILWGVCRYWAGIVDRSPVELLSIYGYGMAVWIFAAFLCIPPLPPLRVVFTLISLFLSSWFLFRNLWPILSASEHPGKSKPLIIVAVILHLGFVLTLWAVFLGVKKFEDGVGGDQDGPGSGLGRR